jgi:hypothetical protein
MADEDSVLEEAMGNLKKAGQRIRATQSLMRSEGMIDDGDYRELLSRLSTSLAMSKRPTWRRVGEDEWGRGYEAVLNVAKSV